MGFLKRMATILGLLHGNGDEGDGAEEEDRAAGRDEPTRRASFSASASASAAGPGVRKGFSVQVPVAVERPHVGPILVPCEHEEGGVQGFTWYGKKLKFDEDGDVADEFLNEVFPDEVPMAELDNQRGLPTFKINYSTRPAAVKKQIVASDGNVRQGIEHRGRLQWV